MDVDVAVVGTGSMGSMALWRLAHAGVRAVRFEQYRIGHDRSAAGGGSRIFRDAPSAACREGPAYVPILRRAFDLWRELEGASRQDTESVRLPPGDYMVVGGSTAYGAAGDEILAETIGGTPELSLTGDRTVTLDAREGRPLAFRTPRPSTPVQVQALTRLRVGGTGDVYAPGPRTDYVSANGTEWESMVRLPQSGDERVPRMWSNTRTYPAGARPSTRWWGAPYTAGTDSGYSITDAYRRQTGSAS